MKKSDFKINVYCISLYKDEFDQFAKLIKPTYHQFFINSLEKLNTIEFGDLIVNIGDTLLTLPESIDIIKRESY